MREIKFRAWDKGNKRMVEVKDLTFLEDGVLAGFKTLGSQERTLNKPNIMQFTGLKDKNGKEIYEGDIVKGANCISEWGDEAPDMKIVAWNEEEAEFEFHNMKNGGHQSGYTFCKNNFEKHFEIIGNIYENPDLLPSQSKEEE